MNPIRIGFRATVVVLLVSAITAFANDGQNGRDGQSRTIIADGALLRVDLSGKNGGDGERGRDGSDAFCLGDEVKNGEDGRRGGEGGSGGDGGNLTLYYSNLNFVKNILADLSGGRGGMGARGGEGGRGCNGGSEGSDGLSGSGGRRGSYGKLFLIPAANPLPASQNSFSALLGEAIDQDIPMSDHLWKTIDHAKSLLHPNSDITKMAMMWERLVSKTVRVSWSANRPIDSFLKSPLLLSYSAKTDILQPLLAVDGWVSWEQVATDDGFRVTAEEAWLESELLSSEFDHHTGNGSDLTFFIKDMTAQSSKINTQITLKLKAKKFLADKVLYSGELAKDLIEKSAEGYILRIGKIEGLTPEDLKKLGQGKKVLAEIGIFKTMGRMQNVRKAIKVELTL